MIKTKNLVIIAVFLIFTSTGCSYFRPNKPDSIEVNCDSPSTNETNKSKSEEVTVEIIVDGTLSMLGYTNFANSRYVNTLELLDSAANTITKLEKRKYYKFGKEPVTITRSEFLQAKLPRFYQKNNQNSNFEYNYIDAAIFEPEDDKVSLIVTDLYQKGDDIQEVTEELKQYLVKQDYAVGLLAIRSEFSGMIYDVGADERNFQWSTNSDESKFHPFYVLILGKYPYVVNFFEELKNKEQERDLIKDDQFVIFSTQVVSEPSFLDSEPPKQGNGLKQRSTMRIKDTDGYREVKVDDKKKTNLLEFTDASKSKGSIKGQATYNLLPYTLLANFSGNSQNKPFELDVKGEFFDQSKNKFISTDGRLKKQIDLVNWQIEASKLTFTTEITSDELSEGTYRFTIDLIPSQFSERPWWREWNASEGSEDGSRTNNLRSFLTELKGVMINEIDRQRMVVGRLCYVVQK